MRTPAALPTLTGKPVATLFGPRRHAARHAMMFTFAPGSPPAPGSLAAGMPALGELTARLHAHARRWTPPAGFTRFAWDLTAALGTPTQPGRWGDWRAGALPPYRAVLAVAATRIAAQLTAYGCRPGRYGLIHADLRTANLLVAPGSATGRDAVTVLDFDDCGLSWYAYDLAAALSFLEHRPDLSELAAGWLAGYRRIGAVDADDIAALPALVTLRRLQLLGWTASHAHTEMARSLGPAFAAETAAVADGYLSGRLLAGLD